MKRIEDLSGERVAFHVRLQPRAARNEVVGWDPAGRLKVRVTAPPVDDSANERLIRLLASFLDVARCDLAIVSGGRIRTKRLTAPQSCKNRLLGVPDI